MATNLPLNTRPTDSASNTKDFFNSYYTTGISLSANDVDAAVGFSNQEVLTLVLLVL